MTSAGNGTGTEIAALDVSDRTVTGFRLVGIYATGRVSGCTAQIATVAGSPNHQIRSVQAKVAKNFYVPGPASTVGGGGVSGGGRSYSSPDRRADAFRARGKRY